MTIKAVDRHSGYEHDVKLIDFESKRVISPKEHGDYYLRFDEVYLETKIDGVTIELNLWEIE